MSVILAIDPGNTQSGYVVVEHDGEEIRSVLDMGKISNGDIREVIQTNLCDGKTEFAIEMIAGMGMTVGQEVFDTCLWVGRFIEAASAYGVPATKIFRREEKLYLCGSLSAKDKNIRQALKDRYGPVGTKKNPGMLYGLEKDMWAAMAVATTYFDKYIRGIKF